MTEASFNLNIAIYSTFSILFGLYSRFIKERLFISESLVALLFGILFGPIGFKLIYPNARDLRRDQFWEEVHQLARFVMTFQTMAAGISLPR